MVNVGNLLQIKGDAVFTTTPHTKVIEALKYMSRLDIGALVVTSGERVVGIISERDFVRMIADTSQCSVDAEVEQYMTREVFTVSKEQTIEDCMEMMTDKRIRHLPVVESGKLVGMISIGDVVREMISSRDRTINQLSDYIEGRGYISG